MAHPGTVRTRAGGAGEWVILEGDPVIYRGIAKAKAAGKCKGRPVSIGSAMIKRLRAEMVRLRSRSVLASPGVRSTARSHRVRRSAI
jgi:hypothetical protein